ncbi:myoferlin isoform X6 [Strongylocentrotus purpuratus]|uniref:C2 domain-containing protein n=1 Tax=Strongylocentrotus purpuratus TaxID=7668 RepID=A0A7M7NU73_STRPU|nr:myoferlin isoform X6 [Strongylocentrotus purpuratus]
MSLVIVVDSGKSLPNIEKFGTIDPFVQLKFAGTKKKTKVVDDSTDPQWGETIEFNLSDKPLTASDSVELEVYDHEKIGRNKLIGSYTLALRDVVKGKQRSKRMECKLKDHKGRQCEGVVVCNVTYKAPAGSEPPPSGGGKGGGGGGDASAGAVQEEGEGDEVDGDGGGDGGGDDEGGDEDGDDDGPGGGGGGGGSGGIGGLKRKKKSRSKLSKKPQDFQVRIKVWEARQLAGGNIHPVCKVTVSNQTKMTRVKKSTNRPYYDEVFFYNFHMSPAELFDEVVNFQVFNSRQLRSDALIGDFKLDIGSIYEEEDHNIANKWLLLSNADDANAGAKGYLLVSMGVLGSGDEAPVFKKADEANDIESNLLRPAGMSLRKGMFIVKAYHAEDVPQMDPAFFEGVKKFFGAGDGERKELVDPYLTVGFAGKKIQSSVKQCDQNPQWNEEIRIPIRFPSMCERLKLQLRDWDRLSSDDYIGTAFLDLSAMSSPGEEGYLPTFGPTFVNFYGSTREFSDLPDQFEDLNMGKGEGVAYRGRVLVKIETKLGDHPEQNLAEIENAEIQRVGKVLGRRKYRLYCAILDASMVCESDDPVEFEVSMGNYGNKLDDSVAPQPSTTQPTNAVYDGCKYYFLPWSENKPLLIVNSDWEDISFRLDSLNMILRKIERLEANMEHVRLATKSGAPQAEIAAQLIGMIDTLIADCRMPLPNIDELKEKVNELDRRKYDRRLYAMQAIATDALKLRENATDVNDAMEDVEGYLHVLQDLAVEPQNCMPDVIIWMLSGSKRIAYTRFPAYHLLYSSRGEDACGKFCGKISSFFLKEPTTDVDRRAPERVPALFPGKKTANIGVKEIPGMLRAKLWLGLEKDSAQFQGGLTDSSIVVFAETYENQMSVLGNWTSKALPRPKWSDASGKIKLPKEKFQLPPGWRWDDDWFKSPELSLMYDADAGQTKFLEDIYEHESRNIPGGSWQVASVPYTNVKDDPTPKREEFPCPEGWQWDDAWALDNNRACDEDGFEYCVESSVASWGPVERTYHLCRRRRWVRPRSLNADPKALAKQKKKEMDQQEGWEYAPLFNMKFHSSERKMDMVRRRRWHRKMLAESPNAAAVFSVTGPDDEDDKKDKDKDEKSSRKSAPRIFVNYTVSHKYQLRAYIYQARDLIASDSDSFSDPFAYVSFLNRSQQSETIKTTLSPTWDQTLIFDEIEIFGDPQIIAANPPEICIEVFDFDSFGSNEFMGRTVVRPQVKLDPSDPRVARLAWHQFYKGSGNAGELLASFELFLMSDGKDLPFMPPKKGELFIVPNGIRPVLQRTGVEILCWGVRNMKKYQLASVTSPSLEFEVGGKIIKSKVIKNTKKNPNFDQPLLFLEVHLPKEELYTPPINIKVRDHRAFGRKPIVGTCSIKKLQPYRCVPEIEGAETTEPGDMPGEDGEDDVGFTSDELAKITSDLMETSVRRLTIQAHTTPEEMPSLAEDGKTPLPPAAQTAPGQPREGSTHSHENAGEADHVIMMPEDEPVKKGDKKKKKDGKGGEEEKVKKKDIFEDEIDWWSKYYASTGETEKCGDYLERGYDKIEIYNKPLEVLGTNNSFLDFCNCYDLNRGKQDSDEDEESSGVGEFKGLFRIYALPGDLKAELPPKQFSHLPPSAPVECVIRVYIVKALDLQPQDPSGLADPYLKIKLGKKKIDDEDDYLPNTLNPVFGKMFEIKTFLPVHKDLKITVMDKDLLSKDDIIGETEIDLENRFLTEYRATVGLPETYNISGPNKWRDQNTPREMLEEYCKQQKISGPFFYGSTKLTVEGKMYNLADFEVNKMHSEHEGPQDQRLALQALRSYPLVREHIETRPLFSPLLPGIEQGKLQMWVDIFPMTLGPPGPPCDITPRQPKKYVVRCIVWNAKDVILDETNIMGEKMSDIYIKGWMAGQDEKQETDVHYRSLNGEGNFNWRFCFPIEYIPPEQVLVIKKKEHFWSLDKTETHVPPVIIAQIWDNDKFSPDDFLGSIELNLNGMPNPAKKARQCSLKQLPNEAKGKEVSMVSLFEAKRLKGWWPVISEESGEREITGKLELELEILTEQEAEERPAGNARDEPNANPMLDPPNRPETSFNFLLSPWKSLKYIIWHNYKWYIIGFLLLLLLVAFIVLIIYNVPGAGVQRLFGNI